MAEITPNELGATDFALREHRSLWYDAWRRLISSKTAILGMVIVSVFVLSSTLAHYFWTYDPRTDLNYNLKLKPPNLLPTEDVPTIHPFGTDKLGRDIFRRVVHGGWNSLRVGIVAVGISLFIGGLLGVLAGFFESTATSPQENILLYGLIGLAFGLLPAWIARQWFMAGLFFVLGGTAAWLESLLAGKSARIIVFASAGMVIGGSAIITNPIFVALICAFLGAAVGAVLGLQLKGSFFSSTVIDRKSVV